MLAADTGQTEDTDMAHRYGWIVDVDHLAEGNGPSDAGTTGPRGIDAGMLARLQSGEGRPFRMLDDDGEIYYSGRILVVDSRTGQDDPGTELDFRPLDDYGMPNAGCTSIEYRTADGPSGAASWAVL